MGARAAWVGIVLMLAACGDPATGDSPPMSPEPEASPEPEPEPDPQPTPDPEPVPTPDPQPEMPPAGITWSDDIRPILETQCVTCHRPDGAAPFALLSHEDTVAVADASLRAMQEGTMPPWPPAVDCRDFTDARHLPEGTVETFARWIEQGAPAGDDADAHATLPAPITFEATHTAAVAEPYLPNADRPDDYRCFVLDLDFETDTFLKASAVIPDAGALVHHVLVYAIEPQNLDEIRRAEASEEGEGYTCFGAPFPSLGGDLTSIALGGGLPTQVGSWVPGVGPTILPDDTAVRIKAGSKIVMQVHYNLLTEPPTVDATAFQMRLTQEPPDFLVGTRPLIIYRLDIPADEPEAINRAEFRNYGSRPLQIASVAAHMHLLGSRFKAEVVREDGTQDCLLDIPRWDFNWQQSYGIPALDTVVVGPGESIAVECVYDNSAANQPVVNGERGEPRNVSWGDGTLDEMCMLYMTFVEPFEPAPEGAGVCEGMDACLDACEAGGRTTADCLFHCDVTSECRVCALQSLIPCSNACLLPFGALLSEGCLEDCMINTFILGGDTSACLQEHCAPEYGGLMDCLDPIVGGGACDDSLRDGCGIER